MTPRENEPIEAEIAEDEERDERPARSTRAIERARTPAAIEPWAPSPLATMSEEEFERRVELAVIERRRIARPGAEILLKLAGLPAPGT